MNDIDRARLTHCGKRIAKARAALDAFMENGKEIALDALKDGGTEVEVARLLGVDRMTVRKWAGKR